MEYIGSIPVISPNAVLYENKSPVEYEGRKYGGFCISYNNYDADVYGSDTTAVVLGQMEKFFVLNGDHAQALTETAKTAGFEGCLGYFRSHVSEINKFSDRVE